eukprot:GHVN01067771.1.p1 GENE.GHVN01067771.1~~GHVN01067771.1.p1  ORF type:complete len:534 (-),score=40.64 GHVN01067771.1:822-2423(-)
MDKRKYTEYERTYMRLYLRRTCLVLAWITFVVFVWTMATDLMIACLLSMLRSFAGEEACSHFRENKASAPIRGLFVGGLWKKKLFLSLSGMPFLIGRQRLLGRRAGQTQEALDVLGTDTKSIDAFLLLVEDITFSSFAHWAVFHGLTFFSLIHPLVRTASFFDSFGETVSEEAFILFRFCLISLLTSYWPFAISRRGETEKLPASKAIQTGVKRSLLTFGVFLAFVSILGRVFDSFLLSIASLFVPVAERTIQRTSNSHAALFFGLLSGEFSLQMLLRILRQTTEMHFGTNLRVSKQGGDVIDGVKSENCFIREQALMEMNERAKNGKKLSTKDIEEIHQALSLVLGRVTEKADVLSDYFGRADSIPSGIISEKEHGKENRRRVPAIFLVGKGKEMPKEHAGLFQTKIAKPVAGILSDRLFSLITADQMNIMHCLNIARESVQQGFQREFKSDTQILFMSLIEKTAACYMALRRLLRIHSFVFGGRKAGLLLSETRERVGDVLLDVYKEVNGDLDTLDMKKEALKAFHVLVKN